MKLLFHAFDHEQFCEVTTFPCFAHESSVNKLPFLSLIILLQTAITSPTTPTVRTATVTLDSMSKKLLQLIMEIIFLFLQMPIFFLN